eukprot:3010917-Rhodomonas_salina.1
MTLNMRSKVRRRVTPPPELGRHCNPETLWRSATQKELDVESKDASLVADSSLFAGNDTSGGGAVSQSRRSSLE